jgi:magnesium-protoporphyrin O-methyltransferase
VKCSQCQGIEDVFSQEYVSGELARYRRTGPSKTTRLLLQGIQQEDLQGLTLLDIGGGVGAIQHQLLEDGATSATSVDASGAYAAAAQEEASRRGLGGRIKFLYGNFPDLAERIAPADIVTLDRVICCYHDMEALVGKSAGKARRYYGLVFPRDTWWIRLALTAQNLYMKIRKNPFRSFAHRTGEVEAVLRREGLARRSYRRTIIWQIAWYERI